VLYVGLSKMDGGKKSIESIMVSLNIDVWLQACPLLLIQRGVDTWRHLFGMPSLVAESYANKRKRKHDVDRHRELYKRAHLEKKYHLAPVIADEDYGPDATALDITSQQQLHDICKDFLKMFHQIACGKGYGVCS